MTTPWHLQTKAKDNFGFEHEVRLNFDVDSDKLGPRLIVQDTGAKWYLVDILSGRYSDEGKLYFNKNLNWECTNAEELIRETFDKTAQAKAKEEVESLFSSLTSVSEDGYQPGVDTLTEYPDGTKKRESTE